MGSAGILVFVDMYVVTRQLGIRLFVDKYAVM